VCGFAGYLGIGSDVVVEKLLHLMSDELVHRGPDGSGLWFDDSAKIGISHRRLSIIDLSEAGYQPMISESKRYVIAYNGEIYNHNAIRKELTVFDDQEICWRGHSDTETLLAGIDIWGLEKTLKKLTGMFAFALWDRRERQLSLARDRLGEKPLYYGWQGEGGNASFLFGSELKALLVHPSFNSEINRDAINLLLRHNCIPAPYSIYKGISKLAPGSLLSISLNDREPKIRTYWSAEDIASNGVNASHIGSDEEVLNELELSLRQSIEQQMVADVPLGSFLSGGIDSSLVVALMQELSNQPIKTFTIGFSEDRYNEAKYAKAVSKHLKTDHTELYISPEDAMNVIPRLSELYDEPFSDSSQIPTFLVSQLARQHVKVSLSGDAGDELFCGYNRYILTKRLWDKLSFFPVSLRRKLAAILINIPPSIWSNLFGFISLGNIGDKIHKAAGVLEFSTVDELYLGLISHWDKPEAVVVNSTEPRTILTGNVSDLSYLDPVQKMMLLDLLTFLPDDILTKVDRAAMGVSLETRIPFLDHKVVEFAWRMPMKFKIRNGQSKWALRQILYKYVPKELVERPKMGFGVPIDSWLRGPLRDWAESLLDETRLLNEGFFNPEPIRQKWNEHLTGRRNWQYQLWDVLMFQTWLEKHNR
jgi:asparagine synthase (glutamine-hydrolysing)